MRRLVYLTRAKDDLADIAVYLAERTGDRDFARMFVDRIRARCRKMAALPTMIGRPRPELGDGLRSVVFGNYLIFAIYDPARLRIVRVMEAHRDIEAEMSKP